MTLLFIQEGTHTRRKGKNSRRAPGVTTTVRAGGGEKGKRDRITHFLTLLCLYMGKEENPHSIFCCSPPLRKTPFWSSLGRRRENKRKGGRGRGEEKKRKKEKNHISASARHTTK